MFFGKFAATKVIRSALQNAASVAGLLFTTEVAIAEKKQSGGGMPDMGGMGGMDDMM